jgi:hypothetical protein
MIDMSISVSVLKEIKKLLPECANYEKKWNKQISWCLSRDTQCIFMEQESDYRCRYFEEVILSTKPELINSYYNRDIDEKEAVSYPRL